MTPRRDHDRDDDRSGVRERIGDIAEDAADLVGDVVGLAGAAADRVEDAVESAVGRLFGRRGRRAFGRVEDEVEDAFGDDDDDDEGRGRGRHPGNPKRPGKSVGTSRGGLDGSPLTPGDLQDPSPPSSWVGTRTEMYLPFLFMRANPGDVGTRPVVGPFWESPDVYILGGVSPSVAPSVPPALGQTALAGVDNTVYAHVWNFGRAPAHDVIVEFFWCNPALGIGPGSATRIGEAWLSLGARGSGDAHRVVKCPVPWVATFVNGGHECLLVRAWDLTADPLGTPEWDASLNRHIGQRNIHVATAAEMAGGAQPLTLHVGPLFGAPATVRVERAEPATMPWLQLHTGQRGVFPAQAMPTGAVTLSPPATIGGGPGGGADADQQQVHSDGQQVTLTTTDDPPAAGQAHVYRVSSSQGGQVVGGYTVVVLGG